jgi:hypothetical protein
VKRLALPTPPAGLGVGLQPGGVPFPDLCALRADCPDTGNLMCRLAPSPPASV